MSHPIAIDEPTFRGILQAQATSTQRVLRVLGSFNAATARGIWVENHAQRVDASRSRETRIPLRRQGVARDFTRFLDL